MFLHLIRAERPASAGLSVSQNQPLADPFNGGFRRFSVTAVTEFFGIANDGEIDIHLVIGVAFVMEFSGTLARRIAFASSFVRKDDAVIDARKLAANLRTIQYVPNFANNGFAHKERYVSIEKQPQCLPRWAVTVGDSLNEEIAVKDDAGSKFGHRLFVPASLLADGCLGFFYEVVEFFF